MDDSTTLHNSQSCVVCREVRTHGLLLFAFPPLPFHFATRCRVYSTFLVCSASSHLSLYCTVRTVYGHIIHHYQHHQQRLFLCMSITCYCAHSASLAGLFVCFTWPLLLAPTAVKVTNPLPLVVFLFVYHFAKSGASAFCTRVAACTDLLSFADLYHSLFGSCCRCVSSEAHSSFIDCNCVLLFHQHRLLHATTRTLKATEHTLNYVSIYSHLLAFLSALIVII